LFAVGYIVFALERSHGTCMMYKDVVWMIGVTITNLGFGDFTPSSLVSRCMICMLSLFGIFQTALIVGVLSEALVIPPDEKRILASVEKQRADQIRRHAAAKLIQATWRQHRFRDGRNYNRGFVNALWQWRKVKTSTDTVGQSLEKEFLVDDTAITTTYISRKLDALEKFVRKSAAPQKAAYTTETPKSKWLNAARDGINKKHMMTKLTNVNASNGKQVTETVPQKLNNETVALENETKQRTQQTTTTIKRNVLEPKKETNVESENKRGISGPQYEIIRKLTDQIGGLETKQSLVNNEIDLIKALLKDLLDENSTPNSPIPEVNVADYDVEDGDSSSDDSGPRLNQNRRCTDTHNSARRGAWAAV